MGDGALILAGLALIGWFWYSGRTAHELVLEISATVCDELAVQRLDDTVALRRFQLRWPPAGLRLQRIYSFDFTSDGTDRCEGEIALVGLSLEWVRIKHPQGEYFIDVPNIGRA